MEEDYNFPYPDTDLDFSFTSTATDRTFASTSSARSSLARSSLNLSFNESRLSTTTTSGGAIINHYSRPHRKHDPNWSAINAATTLSSDRRLHLRHLKLLRHLGAGDLGRVFQCRLRDYDYANFALKVVDRDAASAKKLSHVQMEAEVLSVLDHPFLPTLYAHLEVSHYTCLLIDYCSGGDLHSLLKKQPGYRLPLESVRFFAAEVLVALEYLHAKGIVYRDLKPENILLRGDGHIMLSDFDLCFKSEVVPKLENRIEFRPASNRSQCGCFGSRQSKPLKQMVVSEFTAEPTAAFSRSCVGTHEYLAPELVLGNGHGNGVDWWAFGVFIYELLTGTTPFKGGSKESTLRNIASTRDVQFPEGISDVANDLIKSLLVKDPRKRLGCARGASDIKRHPFFDGIKWPLIRTYRPPAEVRSHVRKTKGQVTYIDRYPSSPWRRRWWWMGLKSYLLKSKGLRCKNGNYSSNNSNYYCYKNNSVMRKMSMSDLV